MNNILTFQATLPSLENRKVTGVYYTNDNLFPSNLVSGTAKQKYSSIEKHFVSTNNSVSYFIYLNGSVPI